MTSPATANIRGTPTRLSLGCFLACETLAGTDEIRVTVTGWETRAPWWQRRQWIRGLVLDIDGHGTTQTYGTRCLDAAREMVLEYLHLSKIEVADDVTIIWTDLVP